MIGLMAVDYQKNSTGTDTTNVDTQTPSTPTTDGTTDAPNTATIYVNIVSHNEDTLSPSQGYDFYADPAEFQEQRDATATFAAMLAENGAKYDFQTDWNFLLGVEKHDREDELTNNKNLLRYLVEDLGMSVDPHSHEHLGYNYADVAYLISKLGVTPSGVVGGFIAGPAEQSKLENYWNGAITGSKYPSYSWTPRMLWGGGTGLHIDESSLWISGVWRPQDAEHFDTHDADAPIPVIGHYSSTWEGLDDLLAKQANGELEDGKMYTVTIMNRQDSYDDAYIAEFEEKLKTYADETAAGKIIWVTIPETLTIWQTQYNETPTILHWEGDSAAIKNPSTSGSGLGATGQCGDGICSLFERKQATCSEDC